MGYSLIFDDITTCKADAIVNSLGTEGRVYGRLCSNIIKKADSVQIKNTIDAITNGKEGDIVITNGGKLPSKHIIHIVSPFKKYDNEKNDHLFKTYMTVFNRAIEEGYKTIVVPFLGTGANGYSDNDAYEAVRKAIASIVEIEEKKQMDILDIKVVIYNNSNGKYKHMAEFIRSKECRFREESSNDGSCLIGGVYEEPSFGAYCLRGHEKNPLVRKIKEVSFLMGLVYNCEDALIPEVHKYKYPFDFVTDWLMRRDLKESVLVGKTLLDSHQKINIKKKKQLEKFEIYAIANELEMSIYDIAELMIINGTSFNPQDPIDCFEIDYLLGKYGKLTKREYSEASLEITGIYINLGNAEYYKQLQAYKKNH